MESDKQDVLRVVETLYDYFIDKMKINGNENCLKIFPSSESDALKIITTSYQPIHCIELENNGWANVGILLSLGSKQDRFKLSISKVSVELTPMVGQTKWKVKIVEDEKKHSTSKEHLISDELTKNELEEIWKEAESLFKLPSTHASLKINKT